MTRFIVIRHCEAEGNRERRFQGTYDGEVSQLGTRQLEYLSLRFRNETIHHIYSSSRKRALATAEAVNRFVCTDIQVDDAIMEINAGDWEGKLFSDFPVLFPEEMYLWDNKPHLFVAPNGESMENVYNRMVSCVKQIAVSHSSETIVLCSHGCAIRNLLCWVDGSGFENLKNQIWCANTGVTIFDVDENLQPYLLIKNDISHLPEEIRTLSSQKWNNR